LPEDETEVEPKIERVEFPGKLNGQISAVKDKVAQMPFYNFRESEGGIDIVRVESRNVRKKPFLFYIITVKPDALTLTYSIVPGSSDRLRRAVVIKNLAAMLSVISDSFAIEEGKFFQYVDSVLDSLINGMSQGYSTLFNKYDAVAGEYAELKKLAGELAMSNKNLTTQTSQLSEENKTLNGQLMSLQTYSDDALMGMVEDWIEVHSSAIDVGEFSKTYKVPEPRIEQILDKMVAAGYLELKG
jgi:hypothetical protein